MDINSIQSSVQISSAGTSPNVADKKNIETANSVRVSESQTAQDRMSRTTSTPDVSKKEDVEGMLTGLNDQLQTLQSFLKFEKDEDSQKMVFFIKNSETGETIRQIPSEEFLTISKNISDYLELVKQQPDLSGSKTPSPVGLITSQMA